MYLALLEWARAAELSADRAAALVMADPLQPCRVLMQLAGGSVPGMNFEAFLKQAGEYESEDDLFSRHARFWSELNLTHPVAVRRVKELMEWVRAAPTTASATATTRSGARSRRRREEFEAPVAHYRERFSRILDRAAGGVQELGKRLGSWLERWQSSPSSEYGRGRGPGRERNGRGRGLTRHGGGPCSGEPKVTSRATITGFSRALDTIPRAMALRAVAGNGLGERRDGTARCRG